MIPAQKRGSALQRWILGILFAAGLTAEGLGNVPGGGNTGANATLSETSTTATLSNGIITAVISKSKATVTSMLFNGVQTVSTASGDSTIYFSMDGGTSYENPTGCVFSVTANTGDMVDIACTETWTTGVHPVDWEIHYVLRRGAKGLYVYAILNHPAAYPDVNIGEWRMVWKLPRNSTDFFFENGYVDDLRYKEFPNVTDLANDRTTQIAEITMMNTGRRAGHYYGKYEFAAEYSKIGTWGHASDVNQAGTWIVLGGDDFFNDGPLKQDLTVDTNYHLIHFGRNHFNASSTIVPTGTAWRKMYGPYLLYCNAGASGAACWADAKAQAVAEKSAWPYMWLNTADYPAASGRGTVTGRYKVSDALKPGLTGAGAWVGLATPDTSASYVAAYGAYTWQYDSLNYQYWVRADAAGNFTIPSVRPGTYTLFAFSNGATGEFSQANVTVTAGATTALGDLTRTISRTGTHLAWEIGVSDRDFKEFRHGADYWVPYQWKNFATEWTNPLNLNAATANWATDWNFAHGVYEVGGTDTANGTYSSWKWNINFNLASKPASGSARLIIAFAGSHSGRMYVYVNSSTTTTTTFYPAYNIGNALLRQEIVGKYSVNTVSVPVSALKVGANTITLQQASSSGNGNYMSYDYVALEMPGTLPAQPPATGRSLVWAGGQTADAWDSAATNWTASGAGTAFGAGDAVTFDATGASHPTVALANVLRPAAVTFNAAQSYTLGGPGTLAGTMALTKHGAGTLTLANAGPNSFTGGSALHGGIVAVSDPGALGSGAIAFNGGQLRLDAAGFPLGNSLAVNGPGTITAPAGGGSLNGALSGAATLSLSIPAGAVLTATGSFAAFNGTLAQPGPGTLRLDQGGNTWGGAAIAFDLGTAGKLNNRATGAANVALGALSGSTGARLAGSDQSGAFTDTYTLGGRNTDATFSGQISDGTGTPTAHTVAMTKVGSGIATLSGINSYSGTTTVSAGTLRIAGSLTNAATIDVLNGATLDVTGTVTVASIHVFPGGKLTGGGTLNAAVLNDGLLEMTAGRVLTLNGAVTNNATARYLGGTAPTGSGTFTNNGVLDLITSPQTLPANFVNNGTVLDSSVVVAQTIEIANGSVAVTIQSHPGHGYQLQRKDSLAAATWQNVGAAQNGGSGTVLTFTDPVAPGTEAAFYRVLVTP